MKSMFILYQFISFVVRMILLNTLRHSDVKLSFTLEPIAYRVYVTWNVCKENFNIITSSVKARSFMTFDTLCTGYLQVSSILHVLLYFGNSRISSKPTQNRRRPCWCAGSEDEWLQKLYISDFKSWTSRSLSLLAVISMDFCPFVQSFKII